jgi:hypothetical protein
VSGLTSFPHCFLFNAEKTHGGIEPVVPSSFFDRCQQSTNRAEQKRKKCDCSDITEPGKQDILHYEHEEEPHEDIGKNRVKGDRKPGRCPGERCSTNYMDIPSPYAIREPAPESATEVVAGRQKREAPPR